MGGAAGRFGATFGTALGEALPAFGSMLSEVGEGAAAGIRAGTAEGGATGASEGASIDAAGGAEGNAATKLSQGEQRAVKKINNILNNFKDSDITGTLKDMAGEPVPKGDGTYWDHLKEMDDTLRGLRNHAETLKGISDPVAQGARQRALDTIERVESALRGAGI
ncbi:polymorphic toxin type 28 domain-containing protein [Pseudomonas fluorescens]|uniref:polymorphic toxin type 28 domain-containing protein n=1 Tax=Pseudomonas fluorescens TaxID=294 RepID=UPI003D22BD60